MEQFIKDKKKIGICAVAIIAVIFCGIKYFSSGVNELKKNDTENIFVEDGDSESYDAAEVNNDKKASSSKSKDSSEEQVFTSNSKTKAITVEIKGEVNKPDVYTLDENSIIKDLIEKAGGLTEQADLSNINRAKKLQDHELIYIANKNESTSATANQSAASGGSTSATGTGGSGSTAQTSGGKININTAGAEELKKINGIGDSKANSIISYREQNGSFSSIEDLKNVDGIGEKMFEKMKDQVEV